MSHELAHVVDDHKFATSLVNERSCRVSDPAQENEAGEIAGELLITFEAARLLARSNAADQDVARRFGVSVDHGPMADERNRCPPDHPTPHSLTGQGSQLRFRSWKVEQSDAIALAQSGTDGRFSGGLRVVIGS